MPQSRYIDLQVNGYAGVDFNQDNLSPDQLHAACHALHADGVSAVLATIITEKIPKMTGRLQRIVQLRNQDPLARQIIAGFHIEGPFISPLDGYRGAHPKDAVRPANLDLLKRLLHAADGLTRIFTLAPEADPNSRLIKCLVSNHVRPAAGHTNASFDQLRSAIDAGLTLFTHLGNGCPMLIHRHDNIIQRALALADRLYFTFIADGAHVPFLTLRNYLRLATIQRSIVVTDAIAPAGRGPGHYSLGRWDLTIGNDLVARSPDGSHLVGSAITMRQAEHNLLANLRFTHAQIRQLTLLNPRRVLSTA